MNRFFYTDYVRHALRFYTRNLQLSDFKTDTDRLNWVACNKVLNLCFEKEKNILIFVYSSFDSLPENVFRASSKFGINQNIIWDLMKDAERKIAKLRGLL